MRKTVNKRIPVSLYDIVGIEAWLSKLSAQGLSFENYGIAFAWFQRIEPVERIYRLEPLVRSLEYPDDEMHEWCRQSGWEYVSTINNLFYVFRAPPGTAELHLDNVVQGYALERLNQKRKGTAVMIGILVALMLAMVFAIDVYRDWWVLNLIESPILLNQGLWVLVGLGVLLQSIQEYRAIHRLMTRLKAGLPLEHCADCRKSRKLAAAAKACLIFAALLCVGSSIMSITRYDLVPLSEFASPLPLLPLDRIENGAHWRPCNTKSTSAGTFPENDGQMAVGSTSRPCRSTTTASPLLPWPTR